MKEYVIKTTETTSGKFYIRANSEEEAMEKFAKNMVDGGYRDMMDEVENFSAEIVEHTVIDGTELETLYSPEGDVTFIMEYTYKNGDLVAERVVGYYHGKPNDEDTEIYKNKGTVSIMI